MTADPHWTPISWRTRPAAQMPDYPDVSDVDTATRVLRTGHAIAAPAESERLRDATAGACEGRAFVLQGGDCAESFDDPVCEKVASLARLFGEMTDILGRTSGEIVEIARIAGQFAKPRTSDLEWQNGVALPSYRGDIINGAGFDAASRRPDPKRMLRAHMQAVGTAASLAATRAQGRPIFTSHEALLLPYEEALVRRDDRGRWWATSGHMLWVGDRTRQHDGAHVEFLSGIENVVGVKCGPTVGGDDLLRIAERLNPANLAGKLALIGRFGSEQIGLRLPELMRRARSTGLNAVWMVDPMHGNTRIEGGRKVRRMDDILAETRAFFAIASAEGVHPGGLHLEMSPDPVTECLGDAGPVSVAEMDRNYLSPCDPRLNGEQALALAREVGAMMAASEAGLQAVR